MLPSRTPGGEACYECQNRGCQFVAMVGAECSMIAKPTPPPATPAARKAALYLIEGVRAVKCGAGYLVPSSSRAIVHYVDEYGQCSCEAGSRGRSCWHAALVNAQLDTRRAA